MNEELLGKYKLVVGMEVHVQPKTEQKMFCGCDANIWGAEPNTHTCPTCLGLPGALPVPNLEGIKKAQMLGLALNCVLNKDSRFDRKHYFYPDLPKGYQISQYKQPLCENGKLLLESGSTADIERVHLEEDVAKSFHEGGKTLVDFNKSGLPLIEVVTRPCFRSIEDAVDYCKKLQVICRYLGISEADMEKGQMRLEANISLRTGEMEEKDELPPYKVEVKNINSFKYMEKAVRAEIVRQREILEKGEMPKQENRGYDEFKNITVAQRDKEEASDYRYFPEPDIPPMVFSEKYFNELRAVEGSLPQSLRDAMEKKSVSKEQSRILVEVMGAVVVEKFHKLVAGGLDAVKAATVLINRKDLFELSVEEILGKVKDEGEKVSDTGEIRRVVEDVLAKNEAAITDFKNGKESALQFLLGRVMREMKGKADALVVTGLIKEILKK
ncbi:TPA: Asp-tRNA(Asn)/Glu-tRNA(Gln) amidotransferase subunit GatB [candidate division WWE3 bacterium]|uniref:Aspartyl/glutamyl-tRNA(Asn/Gln) amidotransferase subunit B n=1 Tax=candidate division WWE3 bacterium TaxID=2053526 RepID=A0A354G380_UNCKA|nr:Asp-tRNA(Asn)/Glu-tRNA(Gln) amidotransferase subunit GatB [candidate division WWE3 bacterium]